MEEVELGHGLDLRGGEVEASHQVVVVVVRDGQRDEAALDGPAGDGDDVVGREGDVLRQAAVVPREWRDVEGEPA